MQVETDLMFTLGVVRSGVNELCVCAVCVMLCQGCVYSSTAAYAIFSTVHIASPQHHTPGLLS